jgi:DNA-binding transcriptional LysR family regulator
MRVLSGGQARKTSGSLRAKNSEARDKRVAAIPAEEDDSLRSAEAAGGKTGLTTLWRLHCFEVVVEEAGFKKATARLFITQTALSYQMKHLEDELGAQLFHRRPGGVSLTDAGRLLYMHVKRVSAAVSQAQRAIKELPAAGEVRIGTVNSIGTYFLPPLLLTVRQRSAAPRPMLYRVADESLEALLSNQVDVAILADPRVDKRLRYETLFEERVSLISGRSHPFFGVPSLRARQLRDAQFVSLSQQTPTGIAIRRYLDRVGVTIEPVVSVENVETVKRMVEIGMGVAFLPDMVIERDVVSEANPQGRLYRSLVDPGLTRRIVLVTWNDTPLSESVSAFVEEVRRLSRSWPGVKPAREP